MVAGGKKDATYIADLMKPHICELDQDRMDVDLIFFDGASNVQKAGRILEATFPRISGIHGAEHVVSLFFVDVAKETVVKYLIRLYRRVYGVFGSGGMHAPYALFQKNAMEFNHGKKIGLMRASETRMAGQFIAFLRLLCLKQPLMATVSSLQFSKLKFANNKGYKEQVCCCVNTLLLLVGA